MARQRSTRIVAVGSDMRAPLFDGLAPPDIDAVLAAATQRHYPAGSVIVNQGDPAERLFLLPKAVPDTSFLRQRAEGRFSFGSRREIYSAKKRYCLQRLTIS